MNSSLFDFEFINSIIYDYEFEYSIIKSIESSKIFKNTDLIFTRKVLFYELSKQFKQDLIR